MAKRQRIRIKLKSYDHRLLDESAKKIVETELKEKGTPLHAATVIGDTIGDPYKDTSSVAMNPIIKFTTLFGLLAMEIAIQEEFRLFAPYIAWVFFATAIFFVYRSFYRMKLPVLKNDHDDSEHHDVTNTQETIVCECHVK